MKDYVGLYRETEKENRFVLEVPSSKKKTNQKIPGDEASIKLRNFTEFKLIVILM